MEQLDKDKPNQPLQAYVVKKFPWIDFYNTDKVATCFTCRGQEQVFKWIGLISSKKSNSSILN